MKLFLSALFSIFISITCTAQDINAIIHEADRLEAAPDEQAALVKFMAAVKMQPANLYALTKCSELCARIGGREKENVDLRNNYFKAAEVYAKTALKLYPDNDVANVTMAIAVGQGILMKSGRDRVSAVRELKQYADKAIAENPNNFKAWHVLGRWNFEVSDLNFMERAGAKIMYGGLPDASLSSAIKCYEKAKALNPSFTFNSLELAKAYHRDGQDDKAMQQLNNVLSLKNLTQDDPRIKEEAGKLLKKWG